MRRMFSQKQIEEIIKQGITSGDIPIPEGGTKLYRHVCDFGGGITDLSFISTSSEPLTNDSKVSSMFSLGCLPLCSGTLIGRITARYDGVLAVGQTLKLYNVYDNETEYRSETIGEFTDIVTAL